MYLSYILTRVFLLEVACPLRWQYKGYILIEFIAEYESTEAETTNCYFHNDTQTHIWTVGNSTVN